MTAAVEFQNVTRHFGPVKAVDGVDATVRSGQPQMPGSLSRWKVSATALERFDTGLDFT